MPAGPGLLGVRNLPYQLDPPRGELGKALQRQAPP